MQLTYHRAEKQKPLFLQIFTDAEPSHSMPGRMDAGDVTKVIWLFHQLF